VPNYVNSAAEPQRTYDNQVRTRVERVRQDVDPTGLFAGDTAPIRDPA